MKMNTRAPLAGGPLPGGAPLGPPPGGPRGGGPEYQQIKQTVESLRAERNTTSQQIKESPRRVFE